MLNVGQLRERLSSVGSDLPVKVVIGEDEEYDVDYAFYSLAFDSFVLKINTDGEYYYTVDEYCFHVKHTGTNVSIPITKECGEFIVSEDGVKSMVDNLNKSNSGLIFDFERELMKLFK